MSRPCLVFDMDGVLAEVTESYREAVVQTVRHFTRQTVSRESIQEYKNRGGFNNDWLLSQRLAADLGFEIDYQTVVDYFCAIFFGPNGSDGLIAREQWIPRDGLLERLAARYQLALFTGRLRSEAAITLRRFAPELNFDPLITAEDVVDGKPAPEGLHTISKLTGNAELIYVGDTVDDARCARDARVPFIGIAAKSNLAYAELIALFQREGAQAVIENVNEIEGVLSACDAQR
jgi:HAD superfamily hydrolase (TIGR01548 family)